MQRQSVVSWAVEEWQSADLADARLKQRLVVMGAQAARKPNGKVSAVFRDDAARQGAYGLLENDVVTWEQVAVPIYAATARRCALYDFVYIVIDGSSVSITDMEQTKGFGRVGSDAHGARGLKVMSALAVSPQGVTLGLLAQAYWARPDQPAKHREQRPTSAKETQRWLDVMVAARARLQEHAPTTQGWYQLDREGDAWPVLVQANTSGQLFTVRGHHDRRVLRDDGSKTYLRELLAAQPVQTEYTLAVAAGPKRSARLARIAVRACQVRLDFKDKRTKRHTQQATHVVLAREVGTTPAGERPIEWLLLTNRPIGTAAELRRVVAGYAQRWRIEEFHRTWKSGACNVEAMQLRSFGAAAKWATILATVATRIERLKQLSRQEPDRPASEEFSAAELKAIVVLKFGKQAKTKVPRMSALTIGQATRWVADLGGYTGKSSGGPPGSVVIGRGLEDVLVVARALEALSSKL